jgi:transposase-like protein
MGERRRRFTAAVKAKVAVEAIKGSRPVNDLAGLYQVHPTQVSLWKKQALDAMPGIFADGRRTAATGGDGVEARLYEEIGRLKVEVDFLKKKVGLPG